MLKSLINTTKQTANYNQKIYICIAQTRKQIHIIIQLNQSIKQRDIYFVSQFKRIRVLTSLQGTTKSDSTKLYIETSHFPLMYRIGLRKFHFEMQRSRTSRSSLEDISCGLSMRSFSKLDFRQRIPLDTILLQ